MVDARENYQYHALQPRQLADTLVNPTTGNIRKLGLDLSMDFQEFVNTVSINKHFARSTPVTILSPLAAAMVRSMAERSNQMQLELSFSLRGIKLPGEGHDMFIAAHAVPAINFTQAQRANVSVDPAVEIANATEIAKQTNLTKYFEQNTSKPRGEVGGVGHVHHTGLDKQYWGTPSSMDYRQIEEYFRDPNFSDYQWFLVTKRNDGGMEYTAMWSHRNQQGLIIHERIPMIETFGEIGQGMTYKVFQ